MNRITRSITLAGLVGSLALVACDNSNTPRPATGSGTGTADGTATGTDRTIPPDRSSVGGRDEKSAMDQSNSSEHIDITARIRRAVMEDDSLSTTAKNCTIVTDSTGTVTLRGNVYSQAEKDAIAAKAAAVVGSGRIVNQLVVNP